LVNFSFVSKFAFFRSEREEEEEGRTEKNT
jgi:hypothetical protein